MVERTPAERLADAAVVICPATAGGTISAVAVAVGAFSRAAFVALMAVAVVLDAAALVLLNRLIRVRCNEARADEFMAVINRRAPTE